MLREIILLYKVVAVILITNLCVGQCFPAVITYLRQ